MKMGGPCCEALEVTDEWFRGGGVSIARYPCCIVLSRRGRALVSAAAVFGCGLRMV